VALAVNLLFDAETATAVEAVWAALAAKGITRDMIDLGYPPHVTLVVVDDEALEPQLLEALALGRNRPSMPMTLGPVRRFDNTTVCWLAAKGAGLLDLHAAVAACVPTTAIRAHYRPGQWVPHMTLQTQGDPEAGAAIAGALWPVERPAMAVRLDMCSFLPVVRLDGVDLI
jgi:hypothetical protein